MRVDVRVAVAWEVLRGRRDLLGGMCTADCLYVARCSGGVYAWGEEVRNIILCHA